jgi:thiol-disulfide isomerase/thioredoxin
LFRMRLAATATTSLGRLACVLIGCLTLFTLPGMSGSAQATEVSLRGADVRSIFGEIRKPGAKAVLVNVWATWCDPCRAEMPSLLKFFREHSDEGLRLVLISVDDEDHRDWVVAFLASQGVDFATWMKRGDDMTFIDALDPQWSGVLPASFLFDGRGKVRRKWYGEVTHNALKAAWDKLVPRRNGRTP